MKTAKEIKGAIVETNWSLYAYIGKPVHRAFRVIDARDDRVKVMSAEDGPGWLWVNLADCYGFCDGRNGRSVT